jgi:hypothetical protein
MVPVAPVTTTRISAIVAPTEPLCWLSSGEDVFWSEPRACYRLASLEGPNGRDVLVLRIYPPAIGQAFGCGQDIEVIAVTPAHTGLSVEPLSPLPFDVHVLLFHDRWTADRRSVSPEDLRHVSRGKLMPSRSAAEALDREMQRMNGPRV